MKTITTKGAPAAIGPYAQAVLTSVSEMLFVSGQLGLDPVSGELVSGGIEEQTRQVLTNIRAVLIEAGMSARNVAKTTIFLIDLDAFQTVNSIYGDFFGNHRPVRSTVQVSALPRGALIEIEAIAVKGR